MKGKQYTKMENRSDDEQAMVDYGDHTIEPMPLIPLTQEEMAALQNKRKNINDYC